MASIRRMELAPKRPYEGPVSDAQPSNWVDLYAPPALKPYLKLARWDRPIGTWLLLIPGWWGIALAAPRTGSPYPDVFLLLLFAIGALVMRGAGCTFNDIVDRDIDARVARTQSRPLPSGAVTLRQAWIFVFIQCLVGFFIVLFLNLFTVLLGVASLALVAVYPFMKRITYWPQAFLGLTFNWGVLMGWSAVTGNLDWTPISVYAAAIFWTIGYDTIYAHQDKEDDALIGVGSTALKFGENTKAWLCGFYGMTAILLTVGGSLAGLGWGFYAVLALGIVHLAHQIVSLHTDQPRVCLKIFKSNRDFGLLMFGAIIAGNITA